MSNQPGRTDWAEDDEPDLATALPPPQHTKNKDGSETIVTIFLNDDGKKVKRTQRIRKVTKRTYEKAGVAERRAWPKMGLEAGRPAGPQPDTTTLGENIIFRPQVGFKSGAAEQPTAEEDQKSQALKKMQIKCRICSGEHFTTKCPFKDTMAPEGEAGAGLADLDGDVGAATLQNLAAGGPAKGASGPGGSSYVPPHLRNGGAATGERMGGKFERDDLATLRVTNVSLSSFAPFLLQSTNTFPSRFPNSPKKTSSAPCSSVSVASPVSSSQRTEKQARPRVSLSSASSTDQTPPLHARRWKATVTAISFCASSLPRRPPKEVETMGRQAERRSQKKRSKSKVTQFVCTIARPFSLFPKLQLFWRFYGT
jgi:translation initiation factor 3 subunit G